LTVGNDVLLPVQILYKEQYINVADKCRFMHIH